jgi:hypothetical protein
MDGFLQAEDSAWPVRRQGSNIGPLRGAGAPRRAPAHDLSFSGFPWGVVQWQDIRFWS